MNWKGKWFPNNVMLESVLHIKYQCCANQRWSVQYMCRRSVIRVSTIVVLLLLSSELLKHPHCKQTVIEELGSEIYSRPPNLSKSSRTVMNFSAAFTRFNEIRVICECWANTVWCIWMSLIIIGPGKGKQSYTVIPTCVASSYSTCTLQCKHTVVGCSSGEENVDIVLSRLVLGFSSLRREERREVHVNAI